MAQIPYNPDKFLETLPRAIESYVKDSLTAGLADVEMEFPSPEMLEKKMPLAKPLIHFAQDDKDSRALGFGTYVKEVFDVATETTKQYEATLHLIDYDVGVWVSAEAGGETLRNRLVQHLTNLFSGNGPKKRMSTATNGVEAVNFSGGRNVLDRINDIPVWRTMDMTLAVRVFSRRIPSDLERFTAIESIEQDPALTIDGVDIPVMKFGKEVGVGTDTATKTES